MIEYIPESEIPSSAGNRLYLDYLAGADSARSFFTHGPLDFPAALEDRRHFPFPRAEIARLVTDYNASLGAGPDVLDAARALADEGTFCVIGGQQVGFLGGPAFATYKAAAIVRLARDLERDLGVRVVPVFWLASEDHDQQEINHVFVRQSDGEIGRVSFPADASGRPVADLPVTEAIRQAHRRYLDALEPGPHRPLVESILAPAAGDDYCAWHGRQWTRVFAGHGLVLVRPEVLRPVAGGFLRRVLESDAVVGSALAKVARALERAGYPPQITTPDAGRLYTFDERGRRVRVADPIAHLDAAAEHPERYSTDAAIRPVFADATLPVLADVLGPGEIAYQAMLRPLHRLLEVPQPVLFPRPHYTIMGCGEKDVWNRYGANPRDVLTGVFDLGETMARLVAGEDTEEFAAARAGLAAALEPLPRSVSVVDPGLERTWAGTLKKAEFALAKLEQRTHRARLSRSGLRRQELHALRNHILPRGRLQERTLPLPHFLDRYGPDFVVRLLEVGDIYRFEHALLTLEDSDARR